MVIDYSIDIGVGSQAFSVQQGTESSDLSHISDFFSTPITILLDQYKSEEKFFWGMGVWVLG